MSAIKISWIKAYVIEMDEYCQRPVKTELADELVIAGQISRAQVSHLPFEGILVVQNSGLSNIYFSITRKN